MCMDVGELEDEGQEQAVRLWSAIIIMLRFVDAMHPAPVTVCKSNCPKPALAPKPAHEH